MKKKKYKLNPLTRLLTKTERAIVELQRKAGDFESSSDNELAFRLLKSYTVRGSLSYEQLHLMRELNNSPSRKKVQTEVYLYAMAAGNEIKLGLSSQPETRKKDMQTGNAKEIELLWRLGPIDRKLAHKLEKQLHKKCKRFNVRGEWFTQACMDTVFRFELQRPAVNYTEPEVRA